METLKTAEPAATQPAPEQSARMKELFEHEMTEVLAALKEEVMQVNAQRMQGAATDIEIPEPPAAEFTKIITAPVSVTYDLPAAPDVSGVQVKSELKPAELHLPDSLQNPYKITLGVQAAADAFPAEIRLPETAIGSIPAQKSYQPEQPAVSIADVQSVAFTPQAVKVEAPVSQELSVPSASYVPQTVSAPVKPEITLDAVRTVQYEAPAAVECKTPELPEITAKTVSVQPVSVQQAQVTVELPQLQAPEVRTVQVQPETAPVRLEEIPHAEYNAASVQLSMQKPALDISIPAPAAEIRTVSVQKTDITVDTPAAAANVKSAVIRTECPTVQVDTLPVCRFESIACQVSGGKPELPEVAGFTIPEAKPLSVQDPGVAVPATGDPGYQAVRVEIAAGGEQEIPEIPTWDISDILNAIANGKVS